MPRQTALKYAKTGAIDHAAIGRRIASPPSGCKLVGFCSQEGTEVKLHRLLTISLSAVTIGAFALAASVSAYAGPVIWTNWEYNYENVGGGLTSTTGDLNGIRVVFESNSAENPNKGEGLASLIGQSYPGEGTPTWDAVGCTSNCTFSRGTVPNAPLTSFDSIALTGGTAGVSQIVFAAGSPTVVDPVMAIWSLGDSHDTASFVFINATPSLIAGGGDGFTGGQSISVSGNDVTGSEGSGVIELIGTFGPDNPIQFTTPKLEVYYAFTLGEETVTPPPEDIAPEPETLSLFGLGLLALPLLRASLARRRRV
jgi:hypothetical protein